jgi:hypothetical protein
VPFCSDSGGPNLYIRHKPTLRRTRRNIGSTLRLHVLAQVSAERDDLRQMLSNGTPAQQSPDERSDQGGWRPDEPARRTS